MNQDIQAQVFFRGSQRQATSPIKKSAHIASELRGSRTYIAWVIFTASH